MQQAEACSEIFVNKRFLEDLLQNPIDHVAYPFGGKSAGGQREAILVQDEGYTTAVTTHHGCVFELHLQSPHLLPRIGITGSASSWPRSPVSRWSYRGAAATLVTSPADCLRRFRPPRQSKHGNQRYLLCDEVRARVGDNERE